MKTEFLMKNGEKYLHVLLDEQETRMYQFLLNRALNTLDPQKSKEWISLEEQINNFIGVSTNG